MTTTIHVNSIDDWCVGIGFILLFLTLVVFMFTSRSFRVTRVKGILLTCSCILSIATISVGFAMHDRELNSIIAKVYTNSGVVISSDDAATAYRAAYNGGVHSFNGANENGPVPCVIYGIGNHNVVIKCKSTER